MKKCSTCRIDKNEDEFTKDIMKKDGLNINCRSCCKIRYNKYREENNEKESERNKKYNIEKRKIDKVAMKEYKKEYFQKNKKSISQKRREKYNLNKNLINKKRREDIPKRLNNTIGNMIRKYLRNNGFSKNSRTYQVVGCSPSELKAYIESKFESWMTWENYGKYNGELNFGWELDHIIPISSAESEEDIFRLNHYTNLQPLCGYVNRYIKSDRIDY